MCSIDLSSSIFNSSASSKDIIIGTNSPIQFTSNNSLTPIQIIMREFCRLMRLLYGKLRGREKNERLTIGRIFIPSL